jgi:hypothetical protein
MANSHQGQVRNLSFAGLMRGRVVKNDDAMMDGRLGVFIASLITEVPNTLEAPTPQTLVIPPGLFANGKELKLPSHVKGDNFIWARPTAWLVENGSKSKNAGGSHRIPKVGTMVTVYFENEDPNNCRWLPFSPTINGDAIAGSNLGKGVNLQETLANWHDPKKRTDIHVIAEYDSGNIIAVDNNDNSNSFVIRWANGHTLSIGHAAESGIVLQTGKGHLVQLDENSGEIRISTQTGKSRAVLNDNGNVSITNEGDLTTATKGNVSVSAQGNASVSAGGTVSVKAGGAATVEGSDVTVKGKSSVTIKAPSVKIVGG